MKVKSGSFCILVFCCHASLDLQNYAKTVIDIGLMTLGIYLPSNKKD